MAQQTLETARALYEAFSRRDRDAIFELVHRDFVADMSRSVGPEKGVYEGPAGLDRLLDAYWQALATFEITPTETIARRDSVVVATKGRGVGRASGAEVSARAAHLLDFRGGKLARWTAFQTLADALQAAPAPE